MRKVCLLTFLLTLLGGTTLTAQAQQYGLTTEAEEQNTPRGWKAVALPRIPAITSANTFTITNYGASTSSEDNTKAIQAALDAAGKAGGGVVIIPAGTWLCGPLKVSSKTIIHLSANATLKLLPLGKYPGSENYQSQTTKVSLDNFIDLNPNASDIIIEGEDKNSSVIDGQGAPWWALRDKGGAYKTAFDNIKRGALIRFTSGSRFLVKNIKLQNAPGVNVTVGSGGKGDNGTIHDVIIREPASELKYSESNAEGKNPSHNTDGIPVWAPYVNIYNCDISNGDDNVVIDSNGQFVHIWNCIFGTGHGASIGSFTQNVHDVLWENITLSGTTAGIRLKTQRGRSGDVNGITYRNITMDNVPSPISIDTYYSGKPSSPSAAEPQDSVSTTPYFHNILIQNVTAKNAKNNSIYLYGLPECYISDVTFDNVQVAAQKGMFMAFARNIKFINGSKVTNTESAGKYFDTKYNASTIGDYTGVATSASTGKVLSTLSSSTYTGATNTTQWNFGDGYSVTNNNSKGYGSGNEDGVKYSRGVQFTINLPAGVSVGSVEFKGYDNYDSSDAWLSELNGTTFDANKYVFPKKSGKNNYTVKDYTVALSQPATGSLTFTFGGQQVVMAITLYSPSDSRQAVLLSDASTVYKQPTIDNVDVTLLGRTIYNDGWNTLCLPFAVSKSQIDDVFGSGTKLTEYTGEADGTTMNFTPATSIEAGKPYLIWPEKQNSRDLVFSDVDITETAPQTVGTGYAFAGTFVTTALASDGTNLFLTGANQLAQPSAASATMKGYRAYFVVPSGTQNAKVNFGDTTTGITSVNAVPLASIDAWYTLSGQRLSGEPLHPGIYIHNNKKIAIK